MRLCQETGELTKSSKIWVRSWENVRPKSAKATKTEILISTNSRRVASCSIHRNLKSMKMLIGIYLGSALLETLRYDSSQALFGGLDARSKLGYSVNQFSLTAAHKPSATAVAAGVGYATAAVSASLGAIVSPPIPLSVGTPVLQSLCVGSTSLPPIPSGATLQFTATGNFSDGTASTLASAKQASSNTGVISINVNTGSATASAAGTAVLTATSVWCPASSPSR
jgi:hypothetical protein